MNMHSIAHRKLVAFLIGSRFVFMFTLPLPLTRNTIFFIDPNRFPKFHLSSFWIEWFFFLSAPNNLCGLFLVFWRWMKDLFRLGLQRTIESSDIYQNLSAHDSEQLSTKFEKLWKEEKFKRRPRLLSVIVKMYWLQILSLSIGFAAVDIISRWIA